LWGYLIVIGGTNLLAALIIITFFVESYTLGDAALYLLLAGACSGTAGIAYYYSISKRSASETLGLLFFYPIILAFMARVFLGEEISSISWFGIFVSVTGTLLLSKITFKNAIKELIFAIVLMILMQASLELFVKLASGKVSSFTGAATMMGFSGSMLLTILLSSTKIAISVKEIKLIPYAFMGSTLSILGLSALFVAMSEMPASQVAGLGCLQPVVVLILDSIFYRIRPDIFSPITWDKAPAIVTIAIGSALVVLGGGEFPLL